MANGAAVEPADSKATSRLVSAGAIMAAGTMVSRVLGFVRVALLAYLIGNGTRQADMYDIASTIPTNLYILFAGGALNTVLVPQLVRAAKNDDDGGDAYTNRIMTAFGLIVAFLAVVCTAAAPIIVGHIYASPAWREPEMAAHLESMLLLGYLFLPQIFLYGVFFLLGQILNARDHFGPMMWAPVVNNIVQIGVLGVYLSLYGTSDGSRPFTVEQAVLLGGGATFGIACQTIVMVVCLVRAGYRYRPRFDLRGTGLGHTFSLAKWTLGFVLINQLAFVVIARLGTAATVAGPGAGIAAYNKAYLLFLLPHSLFTVSVTTAMLPSASRLAADGDMHGVARETMRTMRLVAAVLVPFAVAFLALGDPLTQLMFGNGAGARDAAFVGWTLRAFALGLVPFTLQYVCLRAFYALENTRVTFWLQLVIATVQVGVALGLVLPFHASAWVSPALAAAFASAYLVGFGMSFRRLQRDLPDLRALELARQLFRVTVAVLPAGLVAWAATAVLGTTASSPVVTLAVLGVAGLIAVPMYLGLAHMLRIGEVSQILNMVLRRGRGRAVESGDDAESPAVPATEPETQPVTSPVEPESVGDDAWDLEHDDEDVDDESMVDTVIRPAIDPDHVGDAPSRIAAEAGQVLVDRYVLDEPLVQRPETQTWVATDHVLSRQVMIHLLPRDDARNDAVLEAARRSAIATDARFLRVLDAAHEPTDPSPDSPDGPFVVCEYAAGETLTDLLRDGPLSSPEAAWLIREIADALAGTHAQDQYHQHISPDTIIVTPTGNVKIVGFGIHSAIDPVDDADDPAHSDVRDVARLLYAAMTARFPGGPAYGLAAVPPDENGEWLSPRDVRTGVSPALDRICDRVLRTDHGGRAPIMTMTHLVKELNRVLGAVDASVDLERRLQEPGSAASDEDRAEDAWSDDNWSDESWSDERTQPVPVEGTATAALFRDEVDGVEHTSLLPADDADVDAEKTPSDGLPVREPEPSRRWLVVLLAIVAVIAAVSLFLAVGGRGATEPEPTPTAAPAPQPEPIDVTGADDFDPQGQDQEENPDLVDLAVDGDPATSWDTVVYRNPDMAPKNGVGLTFDLAAEAEVREVTLTLKGEGTSLEVRVPEGEDWRVVGQVSDAGQEVTVPVEATRTSQVQVWLTNLPRGTEGGYQGGIAEIEVIGLQ